MNAIRKLILQDVRCFEGRQEFNIRPLTFLVGENSTGKSTVLGCFQALADHQRRRYGFAGLDFNDDPYQMGVFADIARRTRSKKESFMIGFEKQLGDSKTVEYMLKLVADENGLPAVQEVKATFSNAKITFHAVGSVDKDDKDYNDFPPFSIEEKDGIPELVISEPSHSVIGKVEDVFFFVRHQRRTAPEQKELRDFLKKVVPKSLAEELDKTSRISPWKYRRLFGEVDYIGNVSSFAPIRSKPERTYDPTQEGPYSEGRDMPMVLINMSRTEAEMWSDMKEKLIEFGKKSNLFTDIGVRTFGTATNEPFQLQIKVRGPKVNLIDVGYGVSQILPILVRIFRARGNTIFLLQQPEIHLHPKGQAELTSALASIIGRRSFVVETHSDYMVDRARIEIMQGKLSPDQVSLIYLEPSGNKVKVHNISIDEQGNLVSAPDSYRKFFLQESDRLLGFGN